LFDKALEEMEPKHLTPHLNFVAAMHPGEGVPDLQIVVLENVEAVALQVKASAYICSGRPVLLLR
jgi:hypothetical protein